MDDVLESLFGQNTTQLFRARQFQVVHGPIDRLPEWARSGALSSIEQLCRDYRGALQIAQGPTSGVDPSDASSFIGRGGQTAVSGTNPTALLRLGLSVHFGNLEQAVPGASAFLRGIESALSISQCMRLSAFANAPGSGLPLHHDSHDQLLIHLIGEKNFTYREERDAEFPRLSYSPSAPVPPMFEAVYRDKFSDAESLRLDDLKSVTLRPGSCIFLPAGTWHRTEDQKEPCLSLTTAVPAPSRLDLLTLALKSYLGQSAAWRAPVYGALYGDGGDVEVGEVSTLLADLPEQLQKLAFSNLSEAFHLSRIETGNAATYPADRPFEHYIRLPSSSLSIAQEPESSSHLCCRVRVFQMPTTAVLRMDAEARPVLEWVQRTRRGFSIDELEKAHPEFERGDLEELVRQLAQVGFLRPVPALRLSE